MVDEKVISSEALKIITEEFDWIGDDINATYTYRDFYHYTAGVVDLANRLIRKSNEKVDKARD